MSSSIPLLQAICRAVGASSTYMSRVLWFTLLIMHNMSNLLVRCTHSYFTGLPHRGLPLLHAADIPLTTTNSSQLIYVSTDVSRGCRDHGLPQTHNDHSVFTSVRQLLHSCDCCADSTNETPSNIRREGHRTTEAPCPPLSPRLSAYCLLA